MNRRGSSSQDFGGDVGMMRRSSALVTVHSVQSVVWYINRWGWVITQQCPGGCRLSSWWTKSGSHQLKMMQHQTVLSILCVYIRLIRKNIGRQTATGIHEQKAQYKMNTSWWEQGALNEERVRLQSGASIPPETMIHFPPVSYFPHIFEKLSDSEENFQNFTFSRKISW